MEEDLYQRYESESLETSKLVGGSTALVAVQHEQRLYLANLGDCRAVLARSTLTLTTLCCAVLCCAVLCCAVLAAVVLGTMFKLCLRC